MDKLFQKRVETIEQFKNGEITFVELLDWLTSTITREEQIEYSEKE